MTEEKLITLTLTQVETKVDLNYRRELLKEIYG